MKQVLSTGVVKAPHGVRGHVKVHPYSDDFSHFFSLRDVTLKKNGKTRAVEIESVREHGNELLVKFKNIDSPEDARFFSGWDIVVPREQAGRLEEGEVYTADLEGMRLLYNGEEAGKVLSVMDGAQASLLEVLCGDGKIRLVPYLKGIFIDDVDIVSGTMSLLKKELLD